MPESANAEERRIGLAHIEQLRNTLGRKPCEPCTRHHHAGCMKGSCTCECRTEAEA